MTSINLSAVLNPLLSNPQQLEFVSYGEWKAHHCQSQAPNLPSWARAITNGFNASCVGYAFAAGYQAALQALVPTLPKSQLAALCVTEENGNHPKSISTQLESNRDHLTLNGAKKFITGGVYADTLLVAAKTGEIVDNRPVLKLIKISAKLPGITINEMPPLPFVTEINHATVQFENVIVPNENLLAGDGYADYVKPFRTVEDSYVSLALSSYLLKVSLTMNAKNSIIESLIAILYNHVTLVLDSASESVTHLALAGTRAQLEKLINELEPEWKAQMPESFDKWLKDKAILQIASTARVKRTETAWNNLR